MAIRKIIRVTNVGRLKNCTGKGDVTFGRYTLVFAENGRGKTTLCAILRSLKSGEVGYILGRRTLGSVEPPKVEISTEAGTVTFNGNQWTRTMPELDIFDGTFVAENVYVGDAVDTEQRRNLYRFIIGDDNIRLARQIEELDRKIRELSTSIREQGRLIESRIQGAITLQEFLGLPEDGNINDKIAAKERELEAAEAAQDIVQRKGLQPVPVPEIPQSVFDILTTDFVEIAATAEQLVRDHLCKHKMKPHGEAWISEGMGYLQGDRCPFCGQDVSGLALIEAYRNFFSDSYQAFKSELANLEEDIERTLGEDIVTTINVVRAENEVARVFWQQYITFDLPELPSADEIFNVMRRMRDVLLELVRQKHSAPLDRPDHSVAYRAAEEDYEKLMQQLRVYNDSVHVANTAIQVQKKSVSTIDKTRVAHDLARLRAQKTRYEPDVKAMCEQYRELIRERNKLEDSKTRVRQELDMNTQSLMRTYENTINHYLEQFNAGFRLTGVRHNYVGGIPNSVYQIMINNVSVDLGNPRSPLNQPSFRNTLSAGDRSTLALAFFLARVQHDPNKDQAIIVLDDPFTSQDKFRRNETVSSIKRLGEQCKQVIVLSHDIAFLHELWDRLPPGDRKAIQLSPAGKDNTIIQELDIEGAVAEPYTQDIKALQKFVDGQGDPQDIIRRIRPVLESYCRQAYPAYFGAQQTLGEIVRIIREAGESHPLYSSLALLEDLNHYTRPFHHGESPGRPEQHIDREALRGNVEKTLKFVGALVRA